MTDLVLVTADAAPRAERIRACRLSQPLDELYRKACKAQRHRGKRWTLEELEYLEAESRRLCHKLNVV